MRIISKFKDYYDTGLQYGIDMTRVWVREEKIFTESELKLKIQRSHWWYKSPNQNPLGFIGFCGKIYPFLNINGQEKSTYQYDKNKIYYDIDSIRKNIYYDLIYNKPVSIGRWDKYDEKRFIEKVDEITKNKILLDLFQKYKTPVFAGELRIDYNNNKHGYQVKLNPRLKDYAFFKVKNEIEAFSEIEQYIGNILVGEKEVKIPVGSDTELAYSKGFDKWSFRKEPTKKK